MIQLKLFQEPQIDRVVLTSNAVKYALSIYKEEHRFVIGLIETKKLGVVDKEKISYAKKGTLKTIKSYINYCLKGRKIYSTKYDVNFYSRFSDRFLYALLEVLDNFDGYIDIRLCKKFVGQTTAEKIENKVELKF